MSDTGSLARRSASALGWSWLGAAARAGLQLVAQVALARLLGPQAFGQATAVLLVVGVGSLVAELGMPSALIQRPQLGARDVPTALGWMLLCSALIGVAVALLAPWLAIALGDEQAATTVRWAALILPVQVLASLPVALLQRQFAMKRLQAIQLAAYALGYCVVGIGLALGGAGAWSLLGAFTVHALLVGLMGWRALPAQHWGVTLGLAGERSGLLGYGLRTTTANLVNWAIESVDRLMVGATHGAAALGAYSVAANLARAPVSLLVSSAQPVAFAAASRLQDEHERLVRGYLAVTSLGLLAAVPLFGFLAWHADAVVLLLYGPAWRAAAAPFACLCMGVPFFVMLALTGPMLRGLDAVGSEARAQFGVLLVLVLLLALSSGRPVWVVAACVSAATALRAVALALALTRRAALPALTPWRCWAGPLVLLVLTLLVSEVLRGLPPAAAMAASAPAAMLVCAIALRVAGAHLIGAPLAQALINRLGDSRLAAGLCRWSRLA